MSFDKAMMGEQNYHTNANPNSMTDFVTVIVDIIHIIYKKTVNNLFNVVQAMIKNSKNQKYKHERIR